MNADDFIYQKAFKHFSFLNYLNGHMSKLSTKAHIYSSWVLMGVLSAVLLSACYQVGDVVNGAVHDVAKNHTTKQDADQDHLGTNDIDDTKLSLHTSFSSNIPKLTTSELNIPKTNTSKLYATASDAYQMATSEQLTQYDWLLVAVNMQGASMHRYAPLIEQKTGKLSFSDRHIYFNLGCNHNNQSYQLSNGVLKLNDDRVSTMASCQHLGEKLVNLNQLESKFGNQLDGSILQIKTDLINHTAMLLQQKGAKTFVWQGNMKYDVRFGEPVRMFWEVSPNLNACVNEEKKEASCLMVRNVVYDDQGIKIGVGAWRTFYGVIHGFDHQKNLRQIIRLHAYNSTENKKVYYVYDAAVETEVLALPTTKEKGNINKNVALK